MRSSERVRLGQSGASVTRLGLGTAPLGGLFRALPEHQARLVVDNAWDLGLRLFDTAPLYGFGVAEERLGRALASRPRAEYVLATKVGRLLRADAPIDMSQFHQGVPFYEGTPPVNPVFDFSGTAIRRSLEESLERLGVDRVDVVHIHDPDEHFAVALGDAYPALAQLREEGTVRAIGVGMNQAEMLVRFAQMADFDCFLLAGRYTLLDQTGLHELLPLCAERGIAVIAGGVYNSGILADPEAGATFDYLPADREVVQRARQLSAVCARHGVPLKAAAIQFPLGHPAVVSVLTGCRSDSEVEENVRMFEFEIPAELWDELRAEGLLGEDVPIPRST